MVVLVKGEMFGCLQSVFSCFLSYGHWTICIRFPCGTLLIEILDLHLRAELNQNW